MRECYETQLRQLGGAVLAPGATVVDLGSGTGTSTRRLAKLFPQAGSVVGIDLSAYMVGVGRYRVAPI